MQSVRVAMRSGSQTITSDRQLKARYKNEYGISHWLNAQKIRKGGGNCDTCGGGHTIFTKVDEAPPMFYVSLGDQKLLLDSAINLSVNETRYRYALMLSTVAGVRHSKNERSISQSKGVVMS